MHILFAGSIILPLLLLAFWAERSWHRENARAEVEARRSAELVREYALGVIRTQAAILDHMATLVETSEREGGAPLDLHRRLAALNARHPSVLSLGVVNGEGRLVVSSRTHPVDVDISDRAYFQAPRGGNGALQVTRVTLRPGGQDVVILAQRRGGADFAGILLVTIPVQTFTELFDRLAPEDRGSASLLRADGLLLVRHTPAAPPISLPPQVPALRAIASADAGVYRAVAMTDGIERIYGYTRLDDLPLYANYGLSTAALKAAWLRELSLVAALLGLAALLGALAVTLVRRGITAELRHARMLDAEQRADYQEMLLRELHHRVKNSLMTVHSLIGMKTGGPDRDTVLRQRVMALAQVHDLLHTSSLSSRLEFGSFLRALCANPAIVPPERGIVLTCDVEAIEVGVDEAAPLALLVVELITNACKHAFPGGRGGRIEVTLFRRGPVAILSVRDNGVGLPGEGARPRMSGLRLADGLVRQLRGRLDITTDRGTCFTLTLPLGGEG